MLSVEKSTQWKAFSQKDYRKSISDNEGKKERVLFASYLKMDGIVFGFLPSTLDLLTILLISKIILRHQVHFF